MLYYLKAAEKDCDKIFELVQDTIQTIYPRYYPQEVVAFFCGLHNRDAICEDIQKGLVRILMQKQEIVGTGSYRDNHITRVYVAPEYQGLGYGTRIVEYLEEEISRQYATVCLDASLPASCLYEKLGYRTIHHERYGVENGVSLVYEIMEKRLATFSDSGQAKLIILRGNSGSGKTSAARELQRKFGRGTLVIPQDTVRRELLWARDGIGTMALPLLMDLLEYGKKNSAVTILEGILYSDYYRPLFQRALEEYGSNIYAYYYDLPFEETLRRHGTKPNRFSFGEEDMRRWWREKDYIGIIPEEIITADVSLSEAVDRIYRTVSNSSRNRHDNCVNDCRYTT